MYRFTCCMIYYAMAFNTGTLHGNIYLNTFIAGAVEIPAYIVGTYLMDRAPFGRRWTGFIGMAGSGICSFVCVLTITFGRCLRKTLNSYVERGCALMQVAVSSITRLLLVIVARGRVCAMGLPFRCPGNFEVLLIGVRDSQILGGQKLSLLYKHCCTR